MDLVTWKRSPRSTRIPTPRRKLEPKDLRSAPGNLRSGRRRVGRPRRRQRGKRKDEVDFSFREGSRAKGKSSTGSALRFGPLSRIRSARGRKRSPTVPRGGIVYEVRASGPKASAPWGALEPRALRFPLPQGA